MRRLYVSGRVIVVGSVNVDLVVTVATLPRPGETVTGGRLDRHQGGKGANQAVAAARLGADVALVGAVGGDAAADAALAALAGEGVDVAHVRRLAHDATGLAAIVVDAGGENQIAVAPGANAAVDGAQVRSALDALAIRSDDVLLLCLEIGDEAVTEAARAAAGAGATAILNPAPARALPEAVVAAAPLLTPNETEAQALGGDAHALAARTGAPVLVTRGAAGALLVDGDRELALAAVAVDAVDTTGAGDTLNGALAAELARGRALPDAAAFAVAAASLATRSSGARAGMPGRAAVEAARAAVGATD